MHIVTGGLGFIGSNIVKYLTRKNNNEKILIIDRISNRPKYFNLPSLRNIELIDPYDTAYLFNKLKKSKDIKAIYHLGACSDTTESNGEFLYKNNYSFSKDIIDFALQRKVFLINASSASVYGVNKDTAEIEFNEEPINHYAFTKLLVDQYISQKIQEQKKAKLLSLRFFNVYGFGEFAKNRMASLPYKIFIDLKNCKKIFLFGESQGYKAGSHSRDFIYVDDVVETIDKCVYQKVTGIYNLGTSTSRTFNDLALACLNSYNVITGRSEKFNLESALEKGVLGYLEFPNDLNGKYQSYTCANMKKLSQKGIEIPSTTIEDGILKYYKLLANFYKKKIDYERI